LSTLESFIQKLEISPQLVDFSDTMAVIDELYNFTPCAFKNGQQENATGENSGSCKLFAFAKLHDLTEQQTLNCFGQFYYQDVLENPNNNDHQNIRNFIQSGWKGVLFEGSALKLK
jgi:hypothetical protein